MVEIGVIVTPNIEYFDEWEIMLTSEFRLKYFKKEQKLFKRYDIVVHSFEEPYKNSMQISEDSVRKISFNYGSRDFYFDRYFRFGYTLEQYCEGDLTLKGVTLDASDKDVQYMNFSSVSLNQEQARQNNYDKESYLVTDDHVIKLIKDYVVNPILYSYYEWTHKPLLDCLVEGFTEIRNKIDDFSFIDCIESYNISIKHTHITKVGGDDRYYEDKVWDIEYTDDYMSQWLPTKSQNLYSDSGYTSHFDTVNPYQRFTDEEDVYKNKAYSEYSKLEHMQVMLRDLFSRLDIKSLEDLLNYKDIKTLRDQEYYEFLKSQWHMAEVTKYMYESWYERKYYYIEFPDCFLEKLANFVLE